MDEIAKYQVSVDALTIALEERDAYTRSHCDRVVVLASELGEACGLSHSEMQLLHLSALFHDIGKIGIPDHILLKPAALDDEEWSVMKAHSEKGERIVRSARTNFSDDLGLIIRHHHESFDGSGYPDGLCGGNIPLLSRVLLVVDAYDSMSTLRPYHGVKTHSEVIGIMNHENGEKFDPRILGEFSRLIDKSPL
ncbi:Metal dependent phosphohydrolase [Georgfuchsia toluolica]|uniref:Metal dependent phosphohydrolase n=1 Tax=Georgfuchsia toluolica TaxID=424218 RepID=A0A916JAI3_9PROT|nr:HD domain-containing phosphohydrolase [Georgfuchsia toluolica]CAG4885353.1 Metal dependent phosphohydrolase [Georgfuchsia toluolica]